MEADDLLAALLERQPGGSLARQLWDDLPRLQPGIRSSRLIPVKELRGVYRIRETINRRKGNFIQGFPELVSGLDAFQGDVFLHSFNTVQGMRWLVFSDETVSHLIGVLHWPHGLANLRLPQELREKTYTFGNEMAWAAPDAVAAVLWLAAKRCVVVGVELWREQSGHPLWIAASDYSPTTRDVITSQEVARCARKAGEFIQARRQEPGALFNLTWLEPIRPVVAESAFL